LPQELQVSANKSGQRRPPILTTGQTLKFQRMAAAACAALDWVACTRPIVRALPVPAGLVLCLFGAFVLEPAVAVALALQTARITSASGSNSLAAPVGLAAAVVAWRAMRRGGAPMLGALVGVAVGLTFVSGKRVDVVAGVPAAALAQAFGLVFALVPDEAAVYCSAYSGSFLLWRGLSLLDEEVFRPGTEVPGIVRMGSVELWFNTLSFLLVGLIGVCVQLVLVRNHRYVVALRSTFDSFDSYEYTDIP
jgi:hypothetical protein